MTGHDTAESRRRRFRTVAVVGATLGTLMLLELGLRIHHGIEGTYAVSEEARRARDDSAWVASSDPDLVYVHRPNKLVNGSLRIESHGILRPADVEVAKPEGVLRVAVVGDSVGASLYLMYSQRFSALLEVGLSAALHRPVEVLNFSVNGYGTLQEARLLETVVGQFDPDAVLVVYCMNDPAESLFPIGWFRDPDPPTLYSLDLLGPGLRSLFGVPGERPLAPGEGPGGDAGPAWERAYERDGEGWRSVEEGLDQMTAWSEGAGVPLLVAVAPLLMEDDPAGRRTAGMRAQVLSALSERGLASIDLRPRLEALPLATITQWPGDIYHLSAAGHAAAADALLPRLQDLLESREN